jgi:hypothetical protein
MKEDLVRELMDRAGTDVSGKWMSRDHAQVFAELLVRECATICVKVSDTTRIDDTPHEGDVCSYKIKQHFGVEE